MKSWDYITIGSIGFHQVGQKFAYAKMKVERAVLKELIISDDQFEVPENLLTICHFKVKKFPHEMGNYEEIVLKFDSDFIDVQGVEDDSPNSLYFQFWDFANRAESIDLEDAKYRARCYSLYLKENPMLVVLDNEKVA